MLWKAVASPSWQVAFVLSQKRQPKKTSRPFTATWDFQRKRERYATPLACWLANAEALSLLAMLKFCKKRAWETHGLAQCPVAGLSTESCSRRIGIAP